VRRRILANPPELAAAVSRIIDVEEGACKRRPDASVSVVNARRLMAFTTIWNLVHEHTVGYEEIE
jgi:hypothetical protein